MRVDIALNSLSSVIDWDCRRNTEDRFVAAYESIEEV